MKLGSCLDAGFFFFFFCGIAELVLWWQSTVTRVSTLIWRIWATPLDSGMCMGQMHLHRTTLSRFVTFFFFFCNFNEIGAGIRLVSPIWYDNGNYSVLVIIRT